MAPASGGLPVTKHPDIVGVFLEAGADLQLHGEGGKTILHTPKQPKALRMLVAGVWK